MTSPSRAARASWLAALSQAPCDSLAQLAATALEGHAFEFLRAPESGLVMLRGRIGNSGDRFNLGEATVTRCVVRYVGADGRRSAGVGYVLGRDAEHATRVAKLDALLQQPEHHDTLMRDLVLPLHRATCDAREAARSRAESSRVHFSTLQPTMAA